MNILEKRIKLDQICLNTGLDLPEIAAKESEKDLLIGTKGLI